MKRIAILGSTGSIGRQTLEVVALFPHLFEVVAIAGGRRLDLLMEQALKFSPRKMAVMGEEEAKWLKEHLKGPEILWGEEGLNEILQEVDLAVVALSGSVAFLPTLKAIERGIDIGLATKEVLVMGGEIITQRAKQRGVRLIPIDSEHSAIFQLLEGREKDEVESLILTASGGPFYGMNHKSVEKVTPEEVLRHPVWKMGPKVSVDSATMMNKALEIIEAHWLFGFPKENIKVFIHPQGIVHGMILLRDGSLLAYLAQPDMRIPIGYALSYPERLPLPFKRLKAEDLLGLTFEEADPEKIPALKLGFWALEAGGTLPTVLNAANEVAVKAFLEGKIRFTEIVPLVKEVMQEHKPSPIREVEDVLSAHEWAKRLTLRKIKKC
jgi:1-deoxy-D-xylulose-5-phosphate reductoisomerase